MKWQGSIASRAGRENARRRFKRVALYIGCAVAWAVAGFGTAAAAPPTVKRLTGTLITPGNAWIYYSSATTHTNGSMAWSTPPPEMQALARTLGAGRLSNSEYAKNVYNYVHNNIETEFRFGLAKGARGALIDQSGTPFDQAELMVKLLRQGGVAANYQVGTITLNASQFGLWTGLVTGLNESTQTFTANAKPACQLLADGGIPATVNSATSCTGLSGTLTSVTLAHIWVSALGNLYDPSFKQYELRNGIDIPSAMGCGTATASTCGQNLINAVMNGSTSNKIVGLSTIETPNATAINAQVATQTGNLESTILSQYPLARAMDVAGGAELLQSDGDGSPTIPYVASTQYTWTGDIPDQFRTSIGVTMGSSSCSYVMYADEISGRRITYTQGYSGGPLYVDGQAIGCGGGPITFQMNMPYAASSGQYGDDTFTLSAVEPARIQTPYWSDQSQPQPVETSNDGSTPVTLAISFGNSKVAGQEFASNLQSASPVVPGQCVPSTSTPVISRSCESDLQSANAKAIQVYRSLAAKLISGIGKVGITHHAMVGFAYSSRWPGTTYFNVQEYSSVESPSGDSTREAAAFETDSRLLSLAEGAFGQPEQFPRDAATLFFNTFTQYPLTGACSAACFQSATNKFVEVPPSKMASFLSAVPTTNGTGFEPWRQTLLQQAANAGYTVFLNIGADSEFIYKSGEFANTIWASMKGGGAPADPIAAATQPTNIDLKTRRVPVEFSATPETGGANLTAAPDVTAGRGDFPFALPFERTLVAKDQRSWRDSWYQTDYNGPPVQYDTAVTQATAVEAGEPTQLGGGWTHNYAIILNGPYGNAALALGSEQASDAATAMAGIQSLLDLAKIGTPQAKLAASYQSFNIIGQFLWNTYNVSGGGLNDTFTMRKCGAPVIGRRGSSSNLILCSSGQPSPAQYITGDGTDYYFTCSSGEIDKYQTTTDAQLQASQCGGTTFAPAVLQKIAFPSGLGVALSYRWDVVMRATTATRCYFNGCDTPQFQPIAKDLRSISNSLGRSLTFNVNGLFDVNGYPTGFRITSVTTDAGASANYSVANSSGACADSITYSTSVYNLTCDSFTVTNAGNETYRYEYKADSNSPDPSIVQVPNYRVRRIYVPSNQSSPYLNVAYDSRLRVASVTDANSHVKSTYAGALFSSENWKPADVVDGNGNRTSLRFDDDGHQIQSTDALGNRSQNIYNTSGQLLRTIAPEGNAVEYTYDVRGNQLTQCAIGKGRVNWSVLSSLGEQTPQCSASAGDLVTTTVYMEGPTVRADQCSNPKTCNKPQYVIDPKGNRTNYTFCAPSNSDCTIDTGQVRRITTGLNSSGACAIGSACPLTIFGYSPFTGSDGATFYLLTSKVIQIDATHTTTTTYGYDSSNKFVLKEAVADSGGLNLRTCFKFDAGGNLISKTEPNAGLSSCP